MLEDVYKREPQNILDHYYTTLGVFKEFHVLKMLQGFFYIETIELDEYEDIETIEFYWTQSRKSPFVTLLDRERRGSDHNEMKSYSQDIPLYSRLKCLL